MALRLGLGRWRAAHRGRRGWLVPAGAGLTGAVVVSLLLASMQATPRTANAEAATYRAHERVYFIAADETRWNYAPDGKNDITGEDWDETASVFTENGPQRIGLTYIKSLYRAYTDETFTQLAPRPTKWRHLGMLGPMIRAVVGDHVRIVFKNNLKRGASVHVHGLAYDKANEGAPYADGTSGSDTADDDVAPGATYTYNFDVPERAGPGPMDGSSVMWMYHSHLDEVSDTYAGLVGPMIVTKAGMARADGSPVDVDREFAVQFQVTSENGSPYLQRNIDTFTGDPGKVELEDEGFFESNLKHTINGYLYGNQPLAAMTMRVGERVRWYVMGMGTEVDVHTPHFHGNTAVAMGMRTDVLNLLPASMVIADMVPDRAGTWLLHCHVNDHISAGMLTRYQVRP